ncbi:hypothetical protein LTR53_011046, partial [Teratosphaeriaceae sp. CCFEE 6253]
MQPAALPPGDGSSSSLDAEGTTTTGSKRRRPSSLPPTQSDFEQSGEAASEPVASGTETLARASPHHHGSSRENEAMRSSTPPDHASVRYTRTGRVSKANKGQRVHQCEECGK